jgi:hypothetical protein
MEKSSKRGKIPSSDWPLIMARYEAGETLASIARTYDCSPPAISYIVSRTREKPANETPPPAAPSEPQLVKLNGTAPDPHAAAVEPPPAKVETSPDVRVEPQREPPPQVAAPLQPQNAGLREPLERSGAAVPRHPDVISRGAPAATGEARPKLHLGFGNGHAHNGTANAATPDIASGGEPPRPAQAPPPQRDMSDRAPRRPFGDPVRSAGPVGNGDYGLSEGRPPAQMPRGEGGGGGQKPNGSYLDQELRARVDGDIAAFLAAFDAVLAADTQESRFGLREATDRLLRAGARTRIELERLEARVPLAPREGVGHGETGWRYHR